ncbi:glycoside hydrolase family 31 protein (plasmid) [Photobacterium sp. DA100]|uniref:glycoside hydrolase family 31 protein n=1 Tax=Photobacterium sp. DA100 TaxID=3027472 RepID=UPI00247AACCF|nr:TIM-barrel domain-containing protein [Photobacterium sp. DA100]WEM45529.1 glycoside hydrolase family 31 protein [Photobacterium sp. DA100]
MYVSLIPHFDIYKSIINKQLDKADLLDTMLAQGCTHYFEKCFLIYNLANYVRIGKDPSLLEKHLSRVNAYVEDIQQNCLEQQESYFYPDQGVFTSLVGAGYGALYNLNLVHYREDVAQFIIGLKATMYERNTDMGKLVNKSEDGVVCLDILFSVIPFTLFTPEDLVLIEALEEMHDKLITDDGAKMCAEAQQTEFASALLALYYTEKANHNIALSFLSQVKSEPTALIVKDTVLALKASKGVEESQVIHKPLGNENRYEPQPFERSPWHVHQQEGFVVNALIQGGLNIDDVRLQLNNGDEVSLLAPTTIQGDRISFVVEPSQWATEVTYSFVIDGLPVSQEYTFSPVEITTVTQLENIEVDDYALTAAFRIGQESYRVSVERQGGLLLRVESQDSFQPLANRELLDCQLDTREGILAINDAHCQLVIESISISSQGEVSISFINDESTGYYGFGQRYNHINQRGNIVDNYVYNQYKDQGIKTYIPMPYFLTNRGFGMLLNQDEYSEFDLQATQKGRMRISLEREKLSLSIFTGSPYEQYHQFCQKVGQPVMVPEWTLGPWMSSNNWDNQREVEFQLEQTLKYDIPSTVLVIEAWSDEATYYIFNDATYQNNDGGKALNYDDFTFPEWGRWPNPKAMVEKLHEQNIKCVLWQIPILKNTNGLAHVQLDNDIEFATEAGFTAKDTAGNPYKMPEGWFTDSILFDYTNPEACKWWFDKRNYLVDELKIDGFKTDGGEFVFGDDVMFHNGSTGKQMRNAYPNLYISKHYEQIQRNDGITFSRAGYTGAGQMPAHWAGDERSTFSAFKRNLCAGINASMSGIVFWGWDLGGFSGEIPTAELFARSSAMACFCPIMQYHAESKAEFNQDRTPWNIAERTESPWVIDMYRVFAHLRMSMIDYIASESKKAISESKPLMRAMLFDYAEDENVWDIYDQYMFGDDLLVAPIIEEGSQSREVYLPAGQWVNIFTGETFSGEQTVKVTATMSEIPVFIRPSSAYHFVWDNELLKMQLK